MDESAFYEFLGYLKDCGIKHDHRVHGADSSVQAIDIGPVRFTLGAP